MSIKSLKSQLPDSWKVRKLHNVCKINPESLNVSNLKEEDIINYVDIASIDNSSFSISEVKEIGKTEIPSRARRLIRKDDVIVSTVRPYLKGFAKVTEDKANFVCSTGFAVLRAKDNFNSEFLFQWITSSYFINYMISRMVGSNYPAVNTSDVLKAPVITPTTQEQHKIATILSTVDEAIRTLQQLIGAKQTFKRGLMYRLFSQGIGHTEFKESKIGKIPKKWNIMKLNDCISKIIDYRGKSPPKSEYGVKLITARNVKKGFLDFSEQEYIESESYDEWMIRGFPKEGDLLFTTEAPLGNVVMFPTDETYAIAQRLVAIRTDPEVLDSKFLLYYFLSNFGFKEVMKRATGTTAKGIKQSVLRKVPIIIPELDDQRKIAKILTSSDQEIDSLSKLTKQYKALKKGLMQQLLTGKIRVKVK